jgi:hypothetical protein
LLARMEGPWRILAFLAAAGTCIYDIVNISSKLDDVKALAKGMATADVGVGLWLCAAFAGGCG